MAEVRAAVARKTEDGVYRDLRIAQAERHNLQNLRDDEKFLQFYLECLHEAACVDINDFEIRERRRLGAGLLVTALESLDEKYRARLAALEQQVAARPQAAQEGTQVCPPPGA